MTQPTDQQLYEQWREDYALTYEPNYDEHLEADCKAAFLAGMEAARRAQVVPKGWKLVPVEPNKEWLIALREQGVRIGSFESLLTDVLAAAPQPPEVEHPWVAYLNARKVAIQHYHAEGRSFDDIATVLNLEDGAHVERIYNATSAKVEPRDPKNIKG